MYIIQKNFNVIFDKIYVLQNEDNTKELIYEARYNYDQNILPKQKISINQKSSLGEFSLSFIEEKSYTNSLLTTDIETINYEYESNKIKKFNKFRISGSYNAGIEKNNEYLIGYSYFDDCFGINIDFNRKDYIAENIEPNDTLTLTFSFKTAQSLIIGVILFLEKLPAILSVG